MAEKINHVDWGIRKVMILRNIYDVYTIFSQFNTKSQIYKYWV